ncbi:MAG: ATP-binding cassette domain-containing protein [Bacteroidales bacterium]|nr:ATP-binding cassette domain-containing protein [Bacteroidales bacterium]
MLIIRDLVVQNQNFKAGPFNCEISPGECLFVTGENGSGKTTFFLGVSGLLPHKAKTFSWNQLDLLQLPPQKRPLSLLFQKHNLFPHMTVKENIAFSLKHRASKTFQEKSTLEEIKHTYQLESIWHKKPSFLSGGEYQRAALARALCWNPDIIVLDEPFTALDIQWQKELEILIYSLRLKNKIILLSSHNPEKGIGLSDQVLMLNKGQVTFYGKTSDAIEQLKISSSYQATLENIFGIHKMENSGGITTIYIKPELKIYSSQMIPFHARFIQINPSDVLISSQKTETSALNQIKGIIVAIQLYQNIVKVTIDAGILFTAYITIQSWKNRHFQVGEEVYVIFKASQVGWLPDYFNI